MHVLCYSMRVMMTERALISQSHKLRLGSVRVFVFPLHHLFLFTVLGQDIPRDGEGNK